MVWELAVESRDDQALVLANRSFVYALLARTFAEEPDRGFLSILSSPHAQDELMLIQDEWSGSMSESYKAAVARIPSPEKDDECLAKALGAEYVAIFVGPGWLEAQPWESKHIKSAEAAMRKVVLEVRDAYRAAGYLPASYPKVADDFIGLELDFMGKLAAEAYEAYASGDSDRAIDRLSHSKEFLEEHLGKWVEALANAIGASYGACFYGQMAKLANDYVKRDKEVLRGLGI